MDKSNDPPDLSIYQSLLSSFSAEVHTAKASYFHNKINSTFDTRNLFKTFNSLLCLNPCKLQKLIPNHQFSFCWIYLLLLILLTIRSSRPPSYHWALQEFHFAGLNPISMIGLSRWPGEGRYPQNINWSLGYHRDQFLDPFYSPRSLHHWVPSYKHMVSHTIAMLMTHSSISHFYQMIQR